MPHYKYFSLEEIVNHAKKHSPFYRELYKGLPETGWKLKDLPIIDTDKFWEANVSGKNNRVITDKNPGGLVFKSGGTTGAPKHSIFSRSEWRTMCRALGEHFKFAGLANGDRLANLFYGGSLYASFLFISHSLIEAPVNVTHYPLSGAAEPELVLETIKEFDINVLAGVPTTLLRLIDYFEKQGAKININKIFYAGETMFPDQRQRIRKIFPDVVISTSGLASVDAGFLAWADNTCGFNEHRVMDNHTIIEIVEPDTGLPIIEENREGIIIATNLTRKVMPIIRYPIGDYGMWKEPENTPNRKFILLGRSEAGARVGPATVYVSDIARIIEKFSSQVKISNFQLIISHEQELDRLTLNLCADKRADNLDEIESKIVNTLLKERKMIADLIEERLIHPVEIKWIDESQLIINKRTGKCMRVVDNRIKKEI
jgi:phenylacetate-CoA ligase